MGKLLNPYIAGAPVLESSMFFGREDVFGWIERSLSGKYVDHILVIHGQRRVGKTSVLKQIPNFLGEEYIQVFFDLQGRVNSTLERFLYWMARETSRTLRQEYELDVPQPDQDIFSDDAEQLITQYFPHVLNQLDGQLLLLTFDEFDTLAREDIQDSLARPLIAYLRRLMDVDRLNFIYSIGSSGNKLENMQASYTDFFKAALYRKISFLDKASCRRLITKPVEGDIEYDRKAVQKIYEITAGHPYFTQLTCHELFSLCQKNNTRVVRLGDVQAVTKDVIERGTVNLKFVWDEASDLEKWVLACLAQLEKGVSNKDLASLLRDQRVRFVESDMNSAVLHLREKDVLDSDNSFVVHLMRLWLTQNRPLDRVREELTEVNPIANRFIEIGDEYRDRGDIGSAVDSYKQALDSDSRNFRANLSLAQTYLQKKNYPEAIDAFEQTLSIDPEDIPARTGLCNAYLALGEKAWKDGDEDGAIEYFRKVLTFNEAHQDAREKLAAIYRTEAEGHLTDENDDLALSSYKQALDYTPDDETLIRRYEVLLSEKKAKVISGWLQKADKALSRRQWEAAAEAVEKALEIDPENEGLQKRLTDVKDAARQYQLGLYREQVNKARKTGNWDEAIKVLQKAIQLAPGDAALAEQLKEAREARRQAEIDDLLQRAEVARREQAWDEAILAYRQAAEITPEDSTWEERIQEVEKERFQAKLAQYRAHADSAVEQEAWGEAIAALEGYLALDPAATEVEQEIETLSEHQRQDRLADLRSRAQASEAEERWEDAVNQWQEYLSYGPEDVGQAEAALARAKKYRQISHDYQQAQVSIRSQKYGQAVELLQGIIAQDPTYKATSRLLVEAVEARGERKPFWQTAWFYGAAGVAVMAVVGVFLGPRILDGLSAGAAGDPTPAAGETQAAGVPAAFQPTSTPKQPTNTAAPTLTPSPTEAPGTPQPTVEPLIATQRARGTATAQAQAEKLLYKVRVADEEITSLSWSPSGVRYAAASADNRGVRVVDGSSGEVLNRWVANETDILIWSPDGEVIAAGNDQGKIAAFDPDTGEVLDEVDTELGDITSLAWSPEGDQLAVGDENGYLAILNTASQPYRINVFPTRIDFENISVGRLVSISFPQNALQTDELIVIVKDAIQDWDHQLWYSLTSREWQTGRMSYPEPIYLSNALWSLEDEYYIVGENFPGDMFSGGWHLESRMKSGTSAGDSEVVHHGRITHIAWSPDSDFLASAGEEGMVRIWSGFEDTKASTVFDAILRFDIDSIPSRLAWSPAGDTLLVGDDEGSVWAWDVSE